MNLPNVNVTPGVTILQGGMDRISTSMMARDGSADYARNYEAAFGGGFQRAGGIERFSGQPKPSDARYQAFAPEGGCELMAGDAVVGLASGATAIAIACTESYFAFTKVVGTFQVGEEIRVGGVTKAVISNQDTGIDAATDNALNALAADVYRADIARVPGSGPLRGLSSIGSVIYAWRDTADGTACAIHRSTAAGWEAVQLFSELSFTVGATEPAEGATITRGGATATVKRVVLESGDFSLSTAAGRYIVSDVVGTFTAGALDGGAGTIPAAGAGVYIASPITLSPGGRVAADLYNFTASLDTKRLYGCDGVNREFEFDGTVYVPLTIDMPTRATVVLCHKNHVFFGFRGSIQHSGITTPYRYSVVSGAAELGTGDVVTGLLTVAGSEDQAAMLVLCQDAAWVLFGNDSSNWQLTPLSREAGAAAYSAQDCGVSMVYDTPGFRAYKSTDRFGNFLWELESRLIEPLVQNKTAVASMFSKALSRYRVFFNDGTAWSATPGSQGWEWTTLDYGRDIVLAHSTEVGGVTRTFYGDAEGWVYEADIGRSFDGDNIVATLKLHFLSQRSPMLDKTYRYGLLETLAESPFLLRVAAEFDDGTAEKEMTAAFSARLFGRGAIYDQSLFDQAFYDTRRQDRRRVGIKGGGYAVAPIFISDSNDELPHTIKSVTMFYTPRRGSRL